MTYGSLFSGIGGIDLGLERAGWQCKWQVENDDYCNQILAKHWPDVKRYGDIRTVRGSDLEPVDCIAGGFPCQDLSQAGKRIGIEGARSGLWFEFARLVGVVRPRYVLVENVPGILVSDAMRRVVGELARLGYVGCWRSLRAAEFGASHLRKRIFIVAYAAGTGPSPAVRSGETRANGRPNLFEPSGADLGHSQRARWAQAGIGCDEHAGGEPEAGCGMLGDFAPGPSDPRWPGILRERPDLAPALAISDKRLRQRDARYSEADGGEPLHWPSGSGSGLCEAGERIEAPSESPFRGVAPRISSRMDREGWHFTEALTLTVKRVDQLDRAMSDRTKRLGRLGNSVVPQVAQWVAQRINEFESRHGVEKQFLHRDTPAIKQTQ